MVHHQKNLLILFISLSLFVLSKQNLNLSADVPSPDRSNENKCTPQQIHLSLGDQYYTVSRFTDLWLATENYEENQATLIWTAQLKCKFSVRLASLDNPNDQNITEVKQFDHYFYDFSHDQGVENPGKYDITAFIFSIENLKYDHNYEYVIINSADTTQVTGPFKFRLAAPRMELAPQKMLFVGALSVSERGNKTIARLSSEMTENAGSYAGIVYLGDVAYNIHDDNGKKGDDFFNAIQNITSKIPLIVTPGNRDNHDHWDFLNFRIRNPMYSRTQNQYFSFNWQGIHFVSINFDYYNQASQDIQEEMYTWIEQDLTTANDGLHRLAWPFIVVFSHQPIYCMYSDSTSTEDKKCYSYFSQMKAWDALFHRYGVDLMISAHLHSYERMGPINKNESVPFTEHGDDPTHRAIINPTGTVFIIEGAGGNDQYLPNKASGYGYVVDRNPGFGALYATIDNGEYRLRYEHHDSETGNVIDTMNIIKTPEAAVNNNTLQDVFFILAVGLACLGLTFGYIKYNRWKQSKLQEAEDSIPLNKEELRSSKLRYNRPGQRGISMVDM